MEIEMLNPEQNLIDTLVAKVKIDSIRELVENYDEPPAHFFDDFG